MSEPECFCGRPASRGYLCQGCATKLRRDLTTIKDLWVETDVELTRQAKKSRGGTRSRGGAFPLPVSWNAVQDRETIANTVTTWLRDSAGDRAPDDVTTIEDACEWMLTWFSGIVLSPQVAQMAEEMEYAATVLRRLVDALPDRIVVGQCNVCGQDLLAFERADEVVCKKCDRVVDVGTARRERMQAVMDSNGTLEEVATYLTALHGRRYTEVTIRRWVDQRLIEANEVGMVPFARAIELSARYYSARHA